MKLEAVVIPVADVDRAKEFYSGLGWRLDADFAFDNGFRVVQLTPPGSGCSVQFGTKITVRGARLRTGPLSHRLGCRGRPSRSRRPRRPGQRGVPPRGAGCPVPARRHERPRQRTGPGARQLQLVRHVQRPDGNGWLLQEITARLPGRIDPAETTFASTADLASALRRAEAAHGEHEQRTGERDADWPAWYAAYMAAEQAGEPLPT